MKQQFALLLAARIASAALQAVVGLLLARAVDPSLYGLISAATGVLFVWYVFCDLGAMTFISRARAAHHHDDVAGALRLNSWTSALGGLVGAAACVLSLRSEPQPLLAGIAVLALALAVEKNADTILCIPIADGDRYAPAISIAGRRLLSLIIFVPMVSAGFNAVYAYAISYLASSIFAQVHARYYLRRLTVATPGSTRLTAVVRKSTPFLVTNVAIQSRSFDVAIVTAFASPYWSGQYAAASKLASPFMLIPSTLTTLMLPHAVRAGKGRAWAIALRLCLGATVLLVLMIPVAFLVDSIVTVLLGSAYADAAAPLRWMLFSLPFVALSSPLASLLQGAHDEKYVAANSVVFALLVLVGVALGAGIGSGTGAAIATGIVFFLKCMSLLIRIKRRTTGGSSHE